MAFHLPVSPEGFLTVKATSAITTPFVLVKWDISNELQCVVATDEEDPIIGILNAAVAAGGAAKVFCQYGGLHPIAIASAVSADVTWLSATTGGYAETTTDGDRAVAVALETGAEQYDIITCQWFGSQIVADVSVFPTGS